MLSTSPPPLITYRVTLSHPVVNNYALASLTATLAGVRPGGHGRHPSRELPLPLGRAGQPALLRAGGQPALPAGDADARGAATGRGAAREPSRAPDDQPRRRARRIAARAAPERLPERSRHADQPRRVTWSRSRIARTSPSRPRSSITARERPRGSATGSRSSTRCPGAPITGPGSVADQVQTVQSFNGFAALYYPWILVPPAPPPPGSPPPAVAPPNLLIPPSGHMAGVIRPDRQHARGPQGAGQSRPCFRAHWASSERSATWIRACST